MSDIQPKKPYVFQPFGTFSHPGHARVGRLHGVSGVSVYATITGLTKDEADVVADALSRLRACNELTAVGQELGDYEVYTP